MSRLIDTGLEQLANMLMRMGELANRTVSLSLHSYIEGENAYSEVLNLSDTLVLMADEVEDKTFEVMARFQPVASDLRILKSYMKIAYDFARYGRYALDVSQIYERLGGLKKCEDWVKESITDMSDKVLSMVRISIESLKSHDTELAKALSETERQVDAMYFKYLDRLVEKAPATNKCTISSVLVVRYLERIADHATYIAESIIYLTTGEKTTIR
jgi:phosphate transport system protein